MDNLAIVRRLDRIGHLTPRIPIPAAALLLSSSQKPSHGNILVTKRGIIDPLVSKRPEKILNKKIKN